MALAAVVAAIAVVGALKQGQEQARQAKIQGQIADYNKQVSLNQAKSALNASTSQQLLQNRRAGALMGTQRAAIAQSGLGFGGTNADIMDRSGTLSELDQLNLAYEGQVRSQGFSSQAELDDFTGRVSRDNAKRAVTNSYWNAAAAGATSYLNAGGTVYGMGVRKSSL